MASHLEMQGWERTSQQPSPGICCLLQESHSPSHQGSNPGKWAQGNDLDGI